MMRERVKSTTILIYGCLLLFMGIILLLRTKWILDMLFVINCSLLLLLSVFRIATGFLEKDERLRSEGLFHGCFIFILFLLVLQFPTFFTAMIPFLYGLWALLSALVKFISLYAFHVDRVGNRIFVALDAVITLVFALILLTDPLPNIFTLSYVASAFLIFYGVVQISISINQLMGAKIKDRINRQIHFPLPLMISVFLPQRVYNVLEGNGNHRSFQTVAPSELQLPNELEIYFHFHKDGPQSLGHVDISFEDKMYSYGCHDPKHRYLFGTLGDGVLITAKRDRFIKYSIEEEGSTICSFTVELSDDQTTIIRKRINSLMERTVRWKCAYEKNRTGNDYASRIYKSTQGEFYKFSQGWFKTYFAVSTNCVQLVDYFLHFKELGLFRLGGIITPGTYFNFLNSAYQQEKTMVTARTVYKM